jgi:hypothetical protein
MIQVRPPDPFNLEASHHFDDGAAAF